MTYQKILVRLFLAGALSRFGKRMLRHRVWTVESGEARGLRLTLPQNLDYILGSSERPVQAALAEHIRPGHVFYDIGANMGFFSLIAAGKTGAAGRVYAFEPISENASRVRANAVLNGFENITVFDVAVGRNSRNEELLVTEWDGGGALVTAGSNPSGVVATRIVPVVPLDEFINGKGLRLPDFIKIDVEGAELEVMHGMSTTIAAAKPILLYEIDDAERERFQRRWEELDEYITGFGYNIIHLAESYPGMHWNVGHSLALPARVHE